MKDKIKEEIDNVLNDISEYGRNYPVVVTYKGDQFQDYDLITENRIPEDTDCKEMTLLELLSELYTIENNTRV